MSQYNSHWFLLWYFIPSFFYPHSLSLLYLSYLLLLSAFVKPFLSSGITSSLCFIVLPLQLILQYGSQLCLPEDLVSHQVPREKDMVASLCRERTVSCCSSRSLAAGLLLGSKGPAEHCCTQFQKLKMTLLVLGWMNCMLINETCIHVLEMKGICF